MRSFCYIAGVWLLGPYLLGPGAEASQEIDFDTDVAPVLSKAGCNAASCHGSAAGQAGFRLSLFGGDPAFDFRSIVNELEGRRVNHASPPDSLLLAKPTGALDHGGGYVLDPDGPDARLIAEWVAAGAQRRRLRRLDRLSVSPASFSAAELPASFDLRVVAEFSDGQRRDVTRAAVYESQNDAAIAVDGAGAVTVKLAGQHAVIVRFCGQAAAVSITSPIGSRATPLPRLPRANWIDDLVNAKLSQLRLAPAAECSDSEFVRRVSLDLTGRLPTPERAARFAAEASNDKRARLVDELLASPEFTDYWTHRLATQLRVQAPGKDRAAADALYAWLRDRLAADDGWDSIAEALILAQGDSHEVGAATVHRFFATARDEAEYVSETLMGVRLRCANCHNHPLDHWTQDDYHGLAAALAGVDRGRVVRFTGRGEVTHPRTGEPAAARVPGERFLTGAAEPRRELADWLTAADNPYFARAMAGRVWEALMGNGLATPVDDLRVTNPPSNPELLDRLARDFAEHGYRLRPLVRQVCNSFAYGRASTPPEGQAADSRFYSHALPKPLAAEVLADAISDVTGVADDYAGVDRAVNVVDRTESARKLEALGACLPGEACSVATPGGGRGIAAHLHLINGGLINAKITDPSGRLHTMIDRGDSTALVIDALYWRALSRPPGADELAGWVDRIESTVGEPFRKDRLEDFLWALLNSHEFTTNH